MKGYTFLLHFGLEGVLLIVSVGFALQVYRRRSESGFLLLLLAVIAALLSRLVSAIVFSTLDAAALRSSWIMLLLPVQRLISPVLLLAALIVLGLRTQPNQAPPLRVASRGD